jgi:type 1 glutamine amidotransferase
VLRALTVAWLAAAFAAGGEACGGPTAPTGLPNTARLLVVTYTEGFHHDSIPRAEAVIASLAQQHGSIGVSFCRTASDVQQMLSPAALQKLDGVFFANTTGDLGIPDLNAFLSWIRAGHPFLATHSATDTYHNQPSYLDMLGAEFVTHGDQADVLIGVEDRSHPATTSLPNPWPIRDEIYEFRENPRPSVHVLLSLDRHPNDGHPAAGQPGDFVLAWTRMYGAGKVFYTALGHRVEVWDDPRFQAHLAGALRWVFG